jgi:hypothetical protein
VKLDEEERFSKRSDLGLYLITALMNQSNKSEDGRLSYVLSRKAITIHSRKGLLRNE